MADVSERRIRPIQEAVEAKHWKQALQLSEKWHRKGEKSDRFQAIRAYVLAKQQDTSSTKRGRDEIVQLCHRTPAITDLDTIYQIQSALNDLGIGDDEGRKLWERAAAAKPEDKDIAMTWLDEAIDRSDWQSAQKATMALRKSSPKDRNYEFWTIFMCCLMYEDRSISEKERNMFGTLAYRMLSKAADAVPQDPQELLSSGKAIQSPEELSLLVRVYLNTGHVREAKDLLIDSKTLGPQSAIFELDHDLHRSLQLEVLQASKDWPAVLNELRLAVKEPSPGKFQINRMLRILFDAGEQKDNFELREETRECLDGGLKVLPQSRDLRYGMLQLLGQERAKDRCTADDLTDACKQYFSTRCDQLSCFDELRGPLEVLDAKHQQQFVDFAYETTKGNSNTGASSVAPVLSALKLEYCFLISQGKATQTTRDFSRKVVKMYQQIHGMERESGEPGAQLAMLACMALLRANQSEEVGTIDQDLRNISLLQAGFLQRYCLTRCRDNYPSLIVLTRISTMLGAISLSAAFFKKLSIKNLQWENAGHIFLTRLSTLHPQRSKDSEGAFDPLQMLDLATAANFNSVRSVRRLIMIGLDSKSYVNVLETISLRDDLKRSLSKQIYCVESARTKRLRDLPNSEGERPSSGPFVDRRDFSFLPSFEHPDLKPFAQHLEAGPKPKNKWLRLMKTCNAIADLLHEEYYEPPSIKQDDIEELASTLDDIPQLLKTAHDELTETEINNCNLQLHLGKALTLRLLQPATTPNTADSTKVNFDNAIKSIQDWLKDTLKKLTNHFFNHGVIHLAGTPIAPSWKYLHSAFSTLESLQAISLFLAGQAKASKTRSKAKNSSTFLLPAEQRKTIQALVEQIERSIHDSARKLKDNLNASGVLGQLVDSVFGRVAGGAESEGSGDASEAFGKELEKLPDAETVAEGFCAEVREGWEEGLEGVLSVGVKRWK